MERSWIRSRHHRRRWARRLGIAIPTVRSYLDRIRAKWAATDEPVDDIRTLIHEYPYPDSPFT